MTYNLLKGKRSIIFGALNDKSIAWKVAEAVHREGAIFTLSNTPVACRMGDLSDNTISQSPTYTTAGSGVKGVDGLIDFSERMSPLGNADADDCAEYCVVMFSDFTKKVTMQNLYHDGGFSSMGMSLQAMMQYNKSLESDDFQDI